MTTNPMSHEEAARNQMAERFALGDLNQEERERFEAHFFDCNECFEDTRLAAEFLHHAHVVLPPEPEKGRLARFVADLWRPAPALVTALFLCAIGAGFYQNQKVESLKAPALESRFFLGEQTRAGGNEKVIAVRRGVRLSLNADFAPSSEFTSYRVQILTDTGTVKYSLPLHPQENDDSVAVVLPPEVLNKGKYSLNILGQKRDGTWERLPGGGTFYLQVVS